MIDVQQAITAAKAAARQFYQEDLTADLSSHALAGKCDAVFSTEVVEHVYLPRPFARNCHAFLKPGGMLIVTTPYHGYLKNVASASRRWNMGWNRKPRLSYPLWKRFRAVSHFDAPLAASRENKGDRAR